MKFLVCAVLFIALAVPPVASASAPPQYETRAEFVKSLAIALGVSPTDPTAPYFTDVPTSSPYYGYISAAYSLGWIDGVGGGDFAPNAPLTRATAAKIEITALGLSKNALSLDNTPSSFADAVAIPSWALGYVNEAVAIGIIKGEGNNMFSPNSSLTQTQNGFLLSQMLAYKNNTTQTTSSSIGSTIAADALSEIGAPYVWGGASPSVGFDCSGLVQYVASLVGINLPRTSSAQMKAGSPVPISDLEPGDLVFFNTYGFATHVGIYIGNSQFVDATTEGQPVQVNSLSNPYWQTRIAGAVSIASL